MLGWLISLGTKEREGDMKKKKIPDGWSGQRPNCIIKSLNYFDRRADAHVSTTVSTISSPGPTHSKQYWPLFLHSLRT